MATAHTPLRGQRVALDPMTSGDAAALLAAAGSPETFRLFTRPPTPWGLDGMDAYCRYLMEHPATLPYTVRDADSGEVIGSTTYCDLRPEHRAVEIGWTWYAPARRGSFVNPECKLLLLEHAFGGGLFGQPAIRVCLKTDLRNEHSQHAIAKLGARREGVLRSHVLMPDGHRRDTVYFSILEDEWPAVRAGLLARLARSAP